MTDSMVDVFEPDEEPVPVRKIPCEVYSRVCGYYRPTMAWNRGKRQEFKDRVPYKLPNTGATLDKENNPLFVGS